MKKILITGFIILCFVLNNKAFAQTEEKLYGTIKEIKEDNLQTRFIKVDVGDGNVVEVLVSPNEPAYIMNYQVGDKVILQSLLVSEADTTPKYIIIDHNRTGYLAFLFIVFVAMSVIVGKQYGLYSLIGMGISFATIFKFILPRIVAGHNPIATTVIASLIIIPVTFYLSHGFSKKTHVAVIATFISLVLTSIFAAISVNLAQLTGFSSDEAMFLQIGNESINMKGILLAGIIIGFLGVMDDVTVSQAGIVMKISKTEKSMSLIELYKSAMENGRDHVTSMINTLFLVYAGASLPLLLMFIGSNAVALEVINTELVADEIVRTLVGSVGLIIAVPISTFLAAFVVTESS